MSEGAAAVLYDIDGDPMAVENGATIPPLTSSLINAGSDGTNARFIKVDGSGNQIMIGLGTAGTQTGGILTIQGDPAGTPIPISGNITASNASVGANDTAIPGFSTLIGGSDGTNLRPVRIFDADTGGGTQWVLGVGLRKFAGGGSVELGTSSDPIRTDPTGTTTQPISGTVTANQGGSWTVAGTGNFTVVQATASNLRAQLASETTTGTAVPSTAVQVGGSDGTNLRPFFTDSSGRQIVIGAAANGATVTGNPVLIAGSDGTNARSIRTATDGTVRVDPTGTTTQPISGTVAATQSGTWTVQPGNTANTTPWLTTINQGGNSATVTASNALKVDGSAVTQPVSGTVTSNQGTANTLANRWPVIITDGTNTMPTADTVARSSFHRITDGTNTAAVKAGSAVPVAADPSLVVTISPNSPDINDTTATGALGALNAAVTLTMAGQLSAGFQLAAGTLVGTIVAEISFDGGTTWNSTYIDNGNKVSSIVFGVANTATAASIIGAGGTGTVRIRVSAYTSGTANITLRASDVHDPSLVSTGLISATTQPPSALQIAGWDSTNVLRVPSVKAGSTAPTVSDQALVVVLSANQQAIPVTTNPVSAVTGIGTGTVTTTVTARTAVRATTYTEPAANAQRSISSSSANDTAAGTGARTVKITYYDSTGAGPSTETITLNGTTTVNTVATNICFIEKIEVITVGSTGSNVGILTLFNATAGGGGTLGTVAATNNKTFWAHHYVPTGKVCSITGLSGNNNNASNGSILTLYAKPIGVANAVEAQISDFVRVGGATSQPVRSYNQLIQVTGPALILCYSACEGTPSIITRAAFDYYDQ